MRERQDGYQMTRLDIPYEFLFYFLFAAVFTGGVCWLGEFVVPGMVPIIFILSALVFGGRAVAASIADMKRDREDRRLLDEIASIRKEAAALVRELNKLEHWQTEAP